MHRPSTVLLILLGTLLAAPAVAQAPPPPNREEQPARPEPPGPGAPVLPTNDPFCGDIRKPLEVVQGASARYVIREDGGLAINAAGRERTLRYEDVGDSATPAALVVARRRGSGTAVLVGCQTISDRGVYAIPASADVREGDVLLVTVFTGRAGASDRWSRFRNERIAELENNEIRSAAYRILSERVLTSGESPGGRLDAVLEQLLANLASAQFINSAITGVEQAIALVNADIGDGSPPCRKRRESALGFLLIGELCERSENVRTKLEALRTALIVHRTSVNNARLATARTVRRRSQPTSSDPAVQVRSAWTSLVSELSSNISGSSSIEAARTAYCDADGERRWLADTTLAPQVRAELPVLSDVRTVRAVRWGTNASVTGDPEATFAVVVEGVPAGVEVAFDDRAAPDPARSVSTFARFLLATVASASATSPRRTSLCSPVIPSASTSRIMNPALPQVGAHRIVSHVVPPTRTGDGATISVLVCEGNACRPTGDNVNVRSRVRVESIAEWQLTLVAGLSGSFGVDGAFGNSNFEAVGTSLLPSQSYVLRANSDLRSYFNFSLHIGVRHRRDWFLGVGTSLSDTSGARSLAQWTLMFGWSPPRAHPLFLTAALGFRMNPTPVDYQLGDIVAVTRNAMGSAAAPALSTSNEPYFVATLGIGIDLAFLGSVADDILKAVRGR